MPPRDCIHGLRRRLPGLAIVVLSLLCPLAVLYGEEVPLIPRAVLFGNPERAAARISPDGTQLAYLAPVNGVLNVWVAPLDDLAAARPVTQDHVRGIRSYFWAYTGKHLVYLQDAGGDEDWHVYRVDLATAATIDLTPLPKVAAEVLEVSHRFPNEILVGLNDRDPQFHDVYRVDLATGERKLVLENPGYAQWIVDEDYQVRFGVKFAPDGSNLVEQYDGQGQWKPFTQIPMEDNLTTQIVGFDKSGRVAYLIDSRGRDTGAMTTWNLDNGTQTVVAENPQADISGAMLHPTENTLEAVSFTYAREEWQVLDPQVAADFDVLRKVSPGDFQVSSRSLDDRHWTVAYTLDNGPVRYYYYHRDTDQARLLFTNQPALEGQPLAAMHPQVIPARDGLKLVSYLTLPIAADSDGNGRPDHPLPLVLNVHGGPWARDSWGFDPEHQWLANRGYAVLSVNYRGSTGFGKGFLNAGNRQWAGAMHHDLLDAVAWAVAEKIADPQQVAIFGGSYGGYATLVGLSMTPDVFACGVDIVGPSNIVTLLKTVPPYWAPMVQMFKDRVGDFTTPEGQEFLRQRSPLTHAGQIKRPLLIGQGANDPRVKQAESDQIVSAMQAKHIPVTYVLFPDEGHGFARPENRLAFFAVAEQFLAQHLAGRSEPIGAALEGSTLQVPSGATDIPGLSEALRAQASDSAKPSPRDGGAGQ